jgi:hypothetical protein
MKIEKMNGSAEYGILSNCFVAQSVEATTPANCGMKCNCPSSFVALQLTRATQRFCISDQMLVAKLFPT